MESAKRRSQRDYTLTFKLSVVDQVEKGELSYKEAQERYGIQGKTTVLTWLRKHGRQDWSPGTYCSGLMKPDTHLGENARQIEVSDDQTTPFLFC
jgi:transposase-like protein